MFDAIPWAETRDPISNQLRDPSGRYLNQWYSILNQDVWVGNIIPEERLYLLKELDRHKRNHQAGIGVFTPDIEALLEPYTFKQI